jgi:RimJ/RimL family protein N-acetyltransferase
MSYGKVIYYKDQYIGDVWCYGIDEINERMTMISVVIFEKQLWGKGIGTEVTKDFVKEVFKKYDIEKIGAFTYSNNLRTIGLLEKVGFTQIQTFIEDGIESTYFEIQDAI